MDQYSHHQVSKPEHLEKVCPRGGLFSPVLATLNNFIVVVWSKSENFLVGVLFCSVICQATAVTHVSVENLIR